MCGRSWEGSRFNDWGSREVVIEDGFAIGFENRFGGHCVSED